MILLIFAGEIIFLLPFVLPRVMRPTFLAVLEINNFELGSCFSFYGVVAMFSYFFGGFLADRFEPKNLMAVALLLTGLGGFVLMLFPSYNILFALYGYWGFTTILLFWAALIKATRLWGNWGGQGKAFGFLDGGRGLVAAGIASLGVLLFSFIWGKNEHLQPSEARSIAFNELIFYSSILILVSGLCMYLFLQKSKKSNSSKDENQSFSMQHLINTLKNQTVWLLMGIVLCAYVGYKTTDFFSLYAFEIMNYSEVGSADIGSLLLYLRPIAGVTVGLLADKSKITSWLIVGFCCLLLGSLSLSSGYIIYPKITLFLISTTITCLGVFAARALYFAAMKEGKIPLAYTGTAVGVISVIGYTPDVFVGPLSGIVLDNNPGIKGFQILFIALSLFAFIGLILSFILYRKSDKSLKNQ